MSGRLVRAGALLAALGTAHTAVNTRLMRRPHPAPPPVRERISVLVPARDEEAHVGACVRAILAQRGVPDLEVLVLDDESCDGTAEVVRSFDDPRLRLLAGGPPPPGWLGKPHACRRLAAAATGEIFVFLDADVDLHPDALAAIVHTLRGERFDLVSAYPALRAESPAERLVQPLLPWSWLTFLPLRLAERSRRPSLCAVGGQCFAITRESYRRAGGHAAVRAAVLEDMALGRRVKTSGGRVGMLEAGRIAGCRMYAGWSEIRAGYGKNLWAAFGPPPAAAATLAALTVAYVVPPVAALRGSRAGAAGFAAAIAGRVLAARSTAGRAWPDAVAHPLSIVLLDWLTIRSWVSHRRGTVQWKGRTL